MGSGLISSARNEDKGKWIEWVGDNVPAGSRKKMILIAVRDWTQSDYRAAGEWLAKLPDSGLKNESVRGYVDAVAKYDPEGASRWALALPDGKQRLAAMRTIYGKMPHETPEEEGVRRAFRRQYGFD